MYLLKYNFNIYVAFFYRCNTGMGAIYIYCFVIIINLDALKVTSIDATVNFGYWP